LAEQMIDADLITYPTQTHPPARLRAMLVPSIAAEYACAAPADLDPSLISPAWRRMSEGVDRYATLPARHRARLLAVLGALAFYDEILRLQPTVDDGDLNCDDNWALIALSVANAHKKRRAGRGHLDLLARVAAAAPTTRLRLSAACSLAVDHCRVGDRDLSQARHWADLASGLHQRTSTGDTFVAALDASIYWRAVSFVSFLECDRSRTVMELDRAQAAADAAVAGDESQSVATRENHHPLLETRTKEALWLGDLDLALERAGRLAAHDPWDAKVRILHGDVLAKCGRIEDAVVAYAAAASLGPPYASAAWFKAGECHTRAGRPDQAAEAYFRSAAEDPSTMSPLIRLAEARSTDGERLARWARRELEARRLSLHVAMS
jgi:tetratricopeptide (TPR) repeat protein